MKRYVLAIVGAVFFVVIQLNYFWQPWIGIYAIPVFLVSVGIWIVLGIITIVQIFITLSEKFKARSRIINSIVLITTLSLIGFFPFGFIDFESMKGKDAMIAYNEGAANCSTTIRLKTNGNFTETSICFGTVRENGKYLRKNDTIWFFYDNVTVDSDHWEFGIIELEDSSSNEISGTFWLYQHHLDTMPYPTAITKYNM